MSYEILPVKYRFVCPRCGVWVSKIEVYRPGGCKCGRCDNHMHIAECHCTKADSFSYEADGRMSMYNWDYDLEDWIENELDERR